LYINSTFFLNDVTIGFTGMLTMIIIFLIKTYVKVGCERVHASSHTYTFFIVYAKTVGFNF
jgi:hypothetical protein